MHQFNQSEQYGDNHPSLLQYLVHDYSVKLPGRCHLPNEKDWREKYVLYLSI